MQDFCVLCASLRIAAQATAPDYSKGTPVALAIVAAAVKAGHLTLSLCVPPAGIHQGGGVQPDRCRRCCRLPPSRCDIHVPHSAQCTYFLKRCWASRGRNALQQFLPGFENPPHHASTPSPPITGDAFSVWMAGEWDYQNVSELSYKASSSACNSFVQLANSSVYSWADYTNDTWAGQVRALQGKCSARCCMPHPHMACHFAVW